MAIIDGKLQRGQVLQESSYREQEGLADEF